MNSLKRCLPVNLCHCLFLDLNEQFEEMFTFINLCRCLFLDLNEQFEEMFTFVNLCHCLFLDLNEQFEEILTFVNLCHCLCLDLNEQFEEMFTFVNNNRDNFYGAVTRIPIQGRSTIHYCHCSLEYSQMNK